MDNIPNKQAEIRRMIRESLEIVASMKQAELTNEVMKMLEKVSNRLERANELLIHHSVNQWKDKLSGKTVYELTVNLFYIYNLVLGYGQDLIYYDFDIELSKDCYIQISFDQTKEITSAKVLKKIEAWTKKSQESLCQAIELPVYQTNKTSNQPSPVEPDGVFSWFMRRPRGESACLMDLMKALDDLVASDITIMGTKFSTFDITTNEKDLSVVIRLDEKQGEHAFHDLYITLQMWENEHKHTNASARNLFFQLTPFERVPFHLGYLYIEKSK